MRSPSSASVSSRAAAEQLGDVVEIDMAALVQRDGEGVGGAFDRRAAPAGCEHAFGEDRTLFCLAGLDVVVLDRGDEPDIGIVEEGLQIRATLRSRERRRSLDRSSRWMVVRLIGPKSRTNAVIGDAQADLRLAPGLHWFPGRAEPRGRRRGSGSSLRMIRACLAGMPSRSLAAADRDRRRDAVDDLHQLGRRRMTIAAFLDGRAFGGGADRELAERAGPRRRVGWLGVVDVARQGGDGGVERGRRDRRWASRQAGVGRADKGCSSARGGRGPSRDGRGSSG